jgi:type I restriction enzyme R subunit
MIGRGTYCDDRKLFTVYDYTGATRLFGMPFVSKPKGPEGPTDGGDGPGPEPPPPITPTPPVVVDGFEVTVNNLGQFIVAPVGGQAMPVAIDDYRAGLSARLIAECPTLEDFRARWVNPPDREEMIELIVGAGYSPSVLRMVEHMEDYDLYDVLADLAYRLAPRTRESRTLAFRYKHASWLAGMPAPATRAIEAIADQFAIGGTEGLENPLIWQTPEVVAAGGLGARCGGRTASDSA